MVPLDAATVARLTGAKMDRATLFLPFLQGTCKAYDITSPRRIVGFLSQIGHESAGMSQLQESLNYSVNGLLATFSRRRISVEQANAWGRIPGRTANQEALANQLYGGTFGLEKLGNTRPGDGWLYRGRGLKQLTGRDNYNRCGRAIGEDFINHPDRLLMPVNASLSAGWFWDSKGLNKLADQGDVLAMTKVVNGGVNGLAKRELLWESGMRMYV